MEIDYHAHSTYSDGSLLYRMLEAAEDAGLDGIGFADHCNVSERAEMQRQKRRNGFNLDKTYERRREAIQDFLEERDIAIFDAVEIDYHPDDEALIQSFLDDAGFDYVVGSVHFLDDVNVHVEQPFYEMSEDGREDAVDTYFSHLVDMIESDMVDIVAHADVIERNAALRGIASREHYERVADALEAADAVPEINAGRLLSGYGQTHPKPEFIEVLRDRGIEFAAGTDSHTPQDVHDRVPALQDVFAEYGCDPVTILQD